MLEFGGAVRADINELEAIHTNLITEAMSTSRESLGKRIKMGQGHSVLNFRILVTTNGSKTGEVEAKLRKLVEKETREDNFRKQRVWKRSH